MGKPFQKGFWRAHRGSSKPPCNFLGVVSYTADTLATVATTPTRHRIQPAPKSSAISSRAATDHSFRTPWTTAGARRPRAGCGGRPTEDIPYYHVESGTVPLPYPFDYLSRTGRRDITGASEAKIDAFRRAHRVHEPVLRRHGRFTASSRSRTSRAGHRRLNV